MKHVIFILMGVCFFLSSCLEKELGPQGGSDEEEKMAPDFSFQNTKEKKVTIYAIGSEGEYVDGVPVSVYAEDPYNEDGVRNPNIAPLYYGKTADGGKLEADIDKIPNNVSDLYILTDLPGFGPMQIYDLNAGGDVLLAGPQATDVTETKSLRADKSGAAYEGRLINKAMNLYSYLDNKITNKGIPQVDGDLISKVNLPLEFITLASKWYPEGENVQDKKYLTDAQYCTDMEVKDEYGCEIWVTFLGDGGFSNADANRTIKNMLCYYQYEGNHNALKRGDDSQKLHKTLIFHNTNQREMQMGWKVQLLYWDRKQYVKTFPKGTHIGWAMIQEGYNVSGYNAASIGNVDKYRFSTLELSTVGNPITTQGIARWNDQFKCNIVGMENREVGHRSYDGDYNDILFRVDATPVIKPDVEIPPVDDPTQEIVSTKRFGTLAFEDMFPRKGDWDHNDLVANYTYTLEQSKTTSKIQAIVLEFDIRAIGAIRSNGLGIELPIERSNVARVLGGTLDGNGTSATVIATTNTRDRFNGLNGQINTNPNSGTVQSSGDLSIRVELKKAVEVPEKYFKKFNPFIFVDGRANEIHLSDYPPTASGEVEFGIGDDATDGINYFYKTNENHTWGLDIPRLKAEKTGWIYPMEGVSIDTAYPGYAEWVKSNGTAQTEWYNHPASEHVYPVQP